MWYLVVFQPSKRKKTHLQPQIWSIWPIFPNDSECLPKVCYIKRKNSEILSKLRNSEPVEVSAWQFMVSLRLPNKGGSGREESTWDSVSPTTAVHVGRSLRMFCLMRYIMQYVLQMYENTNEIFAEGGFSFLHRAKSKSNWRLTDLCPTLELVMALSTSRKQVLITHTNIFIQGNILSAATFGNIFLAWNLILSQNTWLSRCNFLESLGGGLDRVAEVGSLSARANMATKVFVRCIFAIFYFRDKSVIFACFENHFSIICNMYHVRVHFLTKKHCFWSKGALFLPKVFQSA